MRPPGRGLFQRRELLAEFADYGILGRGPRGG